MRVCIECKVDKPLAEYHKHQASRGGRRAVCKACLRIRRPRGQADLEKERRYRKTTQGRYVVWGKNLARYGIEPEDWARMFNDQHQCCAICLMKLNINGDNREIHLDHDHETGKIRGILCKPCNSLLGMCDEDEGVLSRAVTYLRRHA